MASKQLYPKINNFRDLLNYSVNNFKCNVAYKYKDGFNGEQGSGSIVEKTYNDVGNDVRALGTALIERGFSGKRIAIIGTNRYEWVVSYFSILTAGVVAAPMDKLLPGIEIESLIQRSNIDAVIFEKYNVEVLKRIKENDSNNLSMLICMDDIDDGEVTNLSTLINEGKELLRNGNTEYDKVNINDDDMSIMLFTSGTTDRSKIVMLSQSNILSNVRAYPSHIKASESDTFLSVLPIHHTFECSITITYGFYCGATIAFSDGIKYVADNLKEYNITVLVAVPLLIENMCKKIKKGIDKQGKTERVNKMMRISNKLLKYHIDIRKIVFKPILKNFGGHLRLIFYGAAAIDKETVEYINALGLKALQGYGLTETSPAIAGESDKIQCAGTTGYPLVNEQIKINNPDRDGIGDILVKGPNVFLGYYGDKEKTDEAFEDGWFITGDLGYINDEGFLTITGRRNDIIVLSNGKNVYPEELELLINRLLYVKESLVFARGKTKRATLLVAKIVYDASEIKKQFPNNAESEYEELIWKDVAEINKSLPVFKHIKQIIVTDKELTKTTTQKIKRFQEIEMIENKEKHVEPKNDEEKQILECMINVLDDDGINVETDFFHAGGDSLSAIDLQIELSKIGIDLNTQEVYDNPTARKIYNYVIESKQAAEKEKIVEVNITSKDVNIKSQSNVFLTGATGFLGIHILNELLYETDCNVYCVVRQSGDVTAKERIINKYKYYFEGANVEEILNKRLFVVKGDVSKPNFGMDNSTYIDLVSKIDIVINSAAAVTHYGDRQYSYECNVVSVDNILEFADKSGALINHISTTSLSGNNLVNTNGCLKDTYSENDLKIGQKYEQNVYLSTKMEAEEHIIEKIKAGKVYANIMRAGNLMNRYSDNLFQDNKSSNAFQNKMKELANIGIAPKEMADFSFDLTPVDMCAKAIVKLALNNSYNNVYHVLNCHEIKFEDIAGALKALNINVEFMDIEDIPSDKVVSKWLINDFLLNNKKKIEVDSRKTVEVLNKLGFSWDIDDSYYMRVLKSILGTEEKIS